MKIFRKVCVTFVMILTLQSVLPGVISPIAVYAENQEGLVQKGNKYYFYEKGQMVKNVWKTVKTDGEKYTYYFGKDGAAYKASKSYDEVYNVKICKIKKKKYGFDNLSHCVKPGIYVSSSSKLLVFEKGGVYSEKKTKKLRKELKTYWQKKQVSKKIYKQVVKKLGKPLSVKRSDSCSPLNMKDSFTDVLLQYRTFEVQLIQNDRTKAYALDNFFQTKEIKK